MFEFNSHQIGYALEVSDEISGDGETYICSNCSLCTLISDILLNTNTILTVIADNDGDGFCYLCNDAANV